MPPKLAVHPDIVYPRIAVPVDMEQKNVWLLRALDDEVNRRSESGLVYEDDIDSQYSYSNSVPNSQQVSKNDLVLLRDNEILLGAAVVQEIEEREEVYKKLLCPRCGSAKLYWRKSNHDWRCDGMCLRSNSLSADERSTQNPDVVQASRVMYTAKYGDTWSDLAGSMLAQEFYQLADKEAWNRQNSIVRLNPSKVLEFFDSLKFSIHQQVAPASPRIVAPGGFAERTVKSRLGQTQFRGHLVSRFGANCAFTGPCYLAVLDAAHLYSYAQEGEHREGGGLLMRKDLHRLFDLGMIGINPQQNIVLHHDLEGTQYRQLQGKELAVTVGKTEQDYLNAHFDSYVQNFAIR
ncbi:HNH endonuclease [Rothia amarae]|uniref:HNH endonuclease n=1 Tax=Rothia amarae TaxID=169480 RepID=UPI0033D221DB